MLPRIIPTNTGRMAATRLMKGILAIPERPNASIVRKGPSLILKIELAPTSSGLPYVAASDI